MHMHEAARKDKPDALAQIDNPILAEHAAEIRRRGKRVVADVIEIGRRLTEAKKIAGPGNWLPWLDREFGWSEDTAERFIRLAALANEIPQVAEYDIPISGLYLLAAPSTPEQAREQIIARAENGEAISVGTVKQTIAKTRGKDGKAREQPAKPKRGVSEIPAPSNKRTHGLPNGSAAVETAKQTGGAAPDDVGPTSAAEVARLQARVEELHAEKRRLEIENTGLRSEVEELKAENGKLRAALVAADDGLNFPAFLDRRGPAQ